MLPRGVCLSAFLVGVSMLGGERQHVRRGHHGRGRPPGPAAARRSAARRLPWPGPAAPPAMARPAPAGLSSSLHAAATGHVAESGACTSPRRRVRPRIRGTTAELPGTWRHRGLNSIARRQPPQRPAMAPAADAVYRRPLAPSAPPAVSERPEPPRETLSPPIPEPGPHRSVTARVQTLQSQKPEGAGARHEQQRLLQSQNRLLSASSVHNSASSTSSSASKSRRRGSATCCRARAPSARPASIACSSACSNCRRKSRKVAGRNARRNGCCRLRNACSSASSGCSKAIWRASSGWARRPRLQQQLPLCRPPHAGDLPRSFRSNAALQAQAALTPGRTAGLPARPGGAAIPQRSWPGSARCSGPTPIPTSSITRSGPRPTTPAIGRTRMTISSTPCSGAPTVRIPLTPDIRNLALAITEHRARGRASVSPQTLRQLCGDRIRA